MECFFCYSGHDISVRLPSFQWIQSLSLFKAAMLIYPKIQNIKSVLIFGAPLRVIFAQFESKRGFFSWVADCRWRPWIVHKIIRLGVTNVNSTFDSPFTIVDALLSWHVWLSNCAVYLCDHQKDLESKSDSATVNFHPHYIKSALSSQSRTPMLTGYHFMH